MTNSEPTVDTGDVRVTHVAGEDRYAITVDGRRVGLLDYRRHGDVLYLDHTEIDPAFGGRGLGAHLVRDALDDVRSRGFTVRPRCSFVRKFIERNPGYADLAAP